MLEKIDLEKYSQEYSWLSELSDEGKEEAVFQIKKFEEMGVAVPTGLIYEQCLKIQSAGRAGKNY